MPIDRPDPSLSLYRLMDPSVLADPYPLYGKLRETDPVHWDPFLHAWVVTGYQDCITVLHKFSAAGDVALFPADRPDVLDYRPGWRVVVRGAFAAFEIAGGHRTMLEAPYVAELAARMNVGLRRALLQSHPVAAPRWAAD
jgi:cytochrome P450